ncbi:hypothetical protein LGH70_22985 [Hymenobacter sp. BT635]|uniref:Uncharacterized protein n=1 Tax=Hymenobacter nitidus TaxID=2880929 RepID=A0ABS8AJF3_9BACT|nr:hypothetical protein [Hymenobacter nitidus]MCB2380477.1 hypothetical protein [Hymenobacter nitidus]
MKKSAPTPAPKKQRASLKTAVQIDRTTHAQLTAATTNMGVTNAEYATAAIDYFTQRGINPLQEVQRDGMILQGKIHDLEKVVTALGNRVFGWLTQHEKNMSGYLRGHERTLFGYLQGMESNVHEHLSGQEELFFQPMLRELFLNNVEALYGRRLGEQIMLKVLGRELAEYPDKHREFNVKRDAEVQAKWNKFVEKLLPTLAPPQATPQPTPWPERPKPAAKPEESTPAASAY